MSMNIRRVIAVGITLAGLFVLDPLRMMGFVAVTSSAVADDRVGVLVEAYNASGQQLFAGLTAAPGNVVLSPYSIGTAMAMTLAGARGETAAEMSRVLMHRLKQGDIDEANRSVLAALNANDRSAKLLTANALVRTNRGDAVSVDYADLLHTKYAAELFQDAGLDDINNWVKRKTEGRIDRMLDQLASDSAAVILNAIYFNARWASVFEKKDTRDEAFNIAPSRRVQVPTMTKTDEFARVAGKGYRAIRLPYEDRALGMVIVLPDRIDDLPAVENALDWKELTRLFASIRSAQARKSVALWLPRFNIAFKANLVTAFKQIGLSKAFSEGSDFGGISAPPPSRAPMRIGQIVHRAVIEVAEKGTEAAAATAVEVRSLAVRPRAGPAVPEPFRVDRPFLFYVVDDTTGLILFQGRINDPRSAAKQAG
jgi:serpin B